MRIQYLLFLMFLCPGFLTGCEEPPPRDIEFQVGSEKFVVSTAKVDGTGSYLPQYQWLKFQIDINTFEAKKLDTLEDKKSAVSMTIGPPKHMDGGYDTNAQYYWSEKDRYLKMKPLSCEEQAYNEKLYKICDLGKGGEYAFAPDIYSIVKAQTGEIITILECSTRHRLSNPLCKNRSRILNSLYINYVYNISHVSRALEIDQRTKEYVLQFHKPLEKENTQ